MTIEISQEDIHKLQKKFKKDNLNTEQIVYQVLLFYNKPLSRPELNIICGLSTNHVSNSLRSLLKKNLINKISISERKNFYEVNSKENIKLMENKKIQNTTNLINFYNNTVVRCKI